LATPIGGLETASNPATGFSGISNTPTGTNGGFAVNPTKNNLPEAQFVLRSNQPWGHVQGGLALLRESLQDGQFLSQNFLGYGGGISGSWRPNWFGFSSKDNFGFNSFAGTGLGHDANPSGGAEPGTTNGLQSNFGLVGIACNLTTGAGCYGNALGALTGGATQTNAALVRSGTIGQRGVEFNYQHWWLPNLRSTATVGWQNNDYNLNLLGRNSTTLNANKQLWTSHANIIWSPVSFVDTGLEFFYGQRLTVLQQRGHVTTLDYAFKVKF
jgi:hypothetical protein